jgi:PAS domain S-box-containing protein
MTGHRAAVRPGQPEERAGASEQRLRGILDGLGPTMLVGLLTTEGIVVDINLPALAAVGSRAEDVLGKALADSYGWSYSETVRQHLRDVIARGARGEASRYDARVRVADGQFIDVDFSLQPRRDDAGKVAFLIASAIVITERKQIENALRESDEKFQQLTEHITDVFWIRSPDMQELHYISPAFERIWGRPMASLRAHPEQWADFVLAEDRPLVLSAFEALKREAPSIDLEYRIVRPDGEIRWVHVRGFQVRDAAGTLIRHTGIVTDITERRLAELEMSRVGELLGEQAALLDIAADAIYVRDLQGRIIYWNKGAERAYGRTADEVLGLRAVDLLPRDPVVYQEAEAALLISGAWHGEMVRRNKADRDVIMAVRWTLVHDAHGQPKSILAINTDITEQKRLESQFLRAQRMEGIGTLAGGIAHDLNNVFAPILMSIEMLKGLVTNEGLAVVATLQASAQRGAALVEQVLAFGRGIEGQRIAVNPLQVMRDLVDVMRDTFPKDIEVRLTPAPDVWNVIGDPTQMHQVFLNLCVNARDAMPGGGMLSIGMENIVLNRSDMAMRPDWQPGPYVLVKVADTGTGVPPEIRNKIFEPFFTTKGIGKGTGLGLSTTQAIVKSHGGFIDLYSAVGRGSAFTVYLPATPSRAPDRVADSADAAMPRGHGELVLVVDDEAAIRDVMRRILERFGYRVLIACDGAEAVSVYTGQHDAIAVVVTDMSMPIMDGPEMIRRLRAMNPGVRIVGSSGLMSNADATSLAGAGVLHFLPKPYTAAAILHALRTALNQPLC